MNFIKTIYGIPIKRIGELIRLFDEQGYHMDTEKSWAELKRHYFNKCQELRLVDKKEQ